MTKSFLIGVLVIAFGGGCSSSHGAAKPDGSSDAGPICPSVGTDGQCVSWAALVANPSCGVQAGPNIYSYEDCGPYHVQVVNHFDTSETYYFDIATGACVAAYTGNGFGPGASPILCLAGPPAGITGLCAPGGSGTWTPTPGICGADGGRDAPSSTDGPSDGRASSDGGDGGTTCPALDVATQCPGGSGKECQPTWAGVLANPYCAYQAPRDQRRDCGRYHVRAVYFDRPIEGFLPDWGTVTYYYDSGTGALVAIYGANTENGSLDATCDADSSGGIESDCLPQANSDGASEGADVCLVDAGTKG